MSTLRLYQIRLPFDHEDSMLQTSILDMLGITASDLLSWKVVKRSLDARPSHRPQYIYCVDAVITKDVPLTKNVEKVPEMEEPNILLGNIPMPQRPIIIGAGPGGLFAGYFLAQYGYNPIILEQGEPIEQRHQTIQNFFDSRQIHPQSNYVFGEGGAGTYSDGKLHTGVTSPWISKILSILTKHGSPPEIQYQALPHIGTDRLRAVIISMRKQMIEWGGEFHFGERMEKLLMDKNGISGIITNKTKISSNTVILAMGSHCRETFEAIFHAGICIESKPFQMGVRIEHLQSWINERLYHQYAKVLPPGSYNVVGMRIPNIHQVCSFCMCPGGEVIPASDRPGTIITNGMSNYKRDSKFANSALVTTITPEDLNSNDPLAGLLYRQNVEELAFQLGGKNFTAPGQMAEDFCKRKISTKLPESSYVFGLHSADFTKFLPKIVAEAIAKALPQFSTSLQGFHTSGVLIGPETRASCPVRILRDKQTRESVSCLGLYPVGEGAGYAGGIISAALDGIHTAITIMAKFKSTR